MVVAAAAHMLGKVLSISLALVFVSAACTSDDQGDDNGDAGSPSASGAGAQAEAGSGHEPGSSGAGGAPDRGGAPTHGGAGAAGGAEQWLFGRECPQPITRELYTSCTFEATCAALGCGDGLSRWDAEGCDRRCDSDADCGDGQRCRFTVISGGYCFGGSYPSDCEPRPDGACDCSWTEDCLYPRVCVDAEAYPASLECAIADATCDDLSPIREIREAISDDRGGRSQAELDAIAACELAMQEHQQQLACD